MAHTVGGTVLFDTLRTASNMTDRILVGVSGGKDSVVTLDVCTRFFKHVVGYFMYVVKGLSFQEATLRFYEKKYGIEIIRIPHFQTSDYMRYGIFRLPDEDVPIISTLDCYNYLREKTGIYWIAAGERISDSVVRRAMIKHSSTIDTVRGRVYPIAYWNKKQVYEYIQRRRLKISPESRIFGHSLMGMLPRDMWLLKQHYPDDYELFKLWYPDVECCVKNYELFKKEKEVNDDGTLKKRRSIV